MARGYEDWIEAYHGWNGTEFGSVAKVPAVCQPTQNPGTCFDEVSKRILLDHADGMWFRPDDADTDKCHDLVDMNYLLRMILGETYALSNKGKAWVHAQKDDCGTCNPTDPCAGCKNRRV
jgi:hypothetical protein